MNDIERIIKRAKLGKASEETQLYLDQFFANSSRVMWEEFLDIKMKGKTDKNVLLEFMELQAMGKNIRDLHRELVMKRAEGKEADEELVNILSEHIKEESNNPQG